MTTKIEAWKTARSVADHVHDFLAEATGRTRDWEPAGGDRWGIDKHELRLKIHPNNGTMLSLTGHAGAFGSSSVYDRCGDDERRYLVRAINEAMPDLAKRAVELARLDAETARLEAITEAESVLREATP